MARLHTEIQDRNPLLDSAFIIIRAATSAAARPIIEEVGYDGLLRPFAEWLGGKHADLRAHFICSTLFGTVHSGLTEIKLRRSKAFRELLIRNLARILQAWVDGHDVP